MMLLQFCCLTYPQQIIVKIFSRCSLVQQQRLLLCHHVRMSRKPPLNEAQCCQIAPKWPPGFLLKGTIGMYIPMVLLKEARPGFWPQDPRALVPLDSLLAPGPQGPGSPGYISLWSF